jgi:hypothetical protein
MMANNEPPIPAGKVLGFPSRRQAEEYLAAHPDGALGGLHFSRNGDKVVNYIVQANTTVCVGARCDADVKTAVGAAAGRKVMHASKAARVAAQHQRPAGKGVSCST